MAGDHGDSEVPVWSTANIAGIPLRNFGVTTGIGNDADAAGEDLHGHPRRRVPDHRAQGGDVPRRHIRPRADRRGDPRDQHTVLSVSPIRDYYGTWCADCRRARRYLDATVTPYEWIDVATDADIRAMLDTAGYRAIPVVVIPTGQILVEPSDDELANVIGTAA